MGAELPPILQAAEQYRAQVLRLERASAVRLVNAYGRAYARLLGDIEALNAAMAELGTPTWGQVERMTLYQTLRRQIAAEVGRYAIVAENEIAETVRALIARGLLDSERLVQLGLPGLEAGILRAVWQRLAPEQVMTMLGFLQDGSPLFENIRRLGDDVAETVADSLRTGIILGYNPRKVADIIRRAAGQGLTWSLNTARTANLWAYREATRANYLANNHVVRGWMWYAQVGDPRTCMSCVVMHGTEHTLDEALDDHHSGRCTMLPITLTYAELGMNIPEDRLQVQRGLDWFLGLNAADQRARMGPSMYDAWQAGEVDLSQLSTPYQDPVYGQMRREPSLVGLIGDRARRYYP